MVINMELGDKFTKNEYTSYAIWANQNGYVIEKTGENEYQVKLPEMEVESEQTEEQGSKLSIDEKRKIRNMYLRKSDKYVLPDFPISSSDLKLAKQYRVYLRDFFEDLKFAENNDIKTFEEYKETLLK